LNKRWPIGGRLGLRETFAGRWQIGGGIPGARQISIGGQALAVLSCPSMKADIP